MRNADVFGTMILHAGLDQDLAFIAPTASGAAEKTHGRRASVTLGRNPSAGLSSRHDSRSFVGLGFF